MNTTDFECQVRKMLPRARFFYDEQSARGIVKAKADMSMFFRTGKDICSMKATQYQAPRVHTPRFVMVESDVSNAFAVWNDESTEVDWVVVTTSLISYLVELGQVLAVYFSRSGTCRAELSFLRPLLDELDSEEATELLGLSLTQLAFIFLVGHELGHHVCGHEILYGRTDAASASAAVDEAMVTRRARHPDRVPGRKSIEPDLMRREMEFQSMELAADHCGVEVLMHHVVRLMRRARQGELGVHGNGSKANRVMHRIFNDSEASVFIASTSVILVFVAFDAGDWEVSGMTNVNHPLPSVRAFAMIELIRSIALPAEVATHGRALPLWGPLSHVALALASVLFSLDIEHRSARDLVRLKMKAWKLLGISRAALTPGLMRGYLLELRQRWSTQRQQCRPAWRYDEPGPIVDDAMARG